MCQWVRKLLIEDLLRTRHSRSQAANKQKSTSCHSGAPLNNARTTLLTSRAPSAVDEVMRSTAGADTLYVNPLGVNNVSDLEQYQGCRSNMYPLYTAYKTQTRIAELERENATLRAEIVERDLKEQQTRYEAQVATYKTLYGLPTEDKERKRLKLWTFLLEYFPDSFVAVANVAIAGNEQHNPGQPLHWAREKSTDQMNTAFRHQFDYGRGVKKDTDGQWHLAKAIWRLSAQLQLDIEAERLNNEAK